MSGRYQITEVEIRDQTGDPENTDLDGDHDFDRFNPAGGLTYSIFEDLTLFGGYSESFRAPTPAELTCADENDPCNLPNAFVADPPLDPVIGRTWEIGARGRLALGEELRLDCSSRPACPPWWWLGAINRYPACLCWGVGPGVARIAAHSNGR